MIFKPRRKFYFILIVCTFLWSQQASFLTQNIAIENSYRDKVTSAVSRLLGQDNFIVIVNVSFLDGAQKKVGASLSGQGSSSGYTPIPGLPTLPSRDGSLPSSIAGSRRLGKNNHSIGSIKVTIELDEELVTDPSIKQEIKSLVKKVIPEISECDDCIKIESLGFLPVEKSKEMQELKREIAELRSLQRQAEEGILKKELQDAENRLNEVQREKEKVDEKIKSRDEELERRDALAHARLVEFEKNRTKQDSIRNINIENELKQIRKNKMRSDSALLNKTMDIVEKQVANNESEKGESLLGMQIGGNGSGIMSSLIFILLIICLMIVTFLAASNKKPKPIYLKPKTKSKKKAGGENSNEEIANNSSEAQPPPAMKRDEDAIQSELRSLRQTAVSLSVGEKESASALIKEWLKDNPNKGENSMEG